MTGANTNRVATHFMRYGIHAEKQYFYDQFRDCYDGVCLNGNLVAYSLKGVCSFLLPLLTDKQFFIDPITHAFGHDPKHISRMQQDGTREPKRAIAALADAFGSPVIDHLGERPVCPQDFSDEAVLHQFTRGVMDFQKSIITEGLQEDQKYIDAEHREPNILIAPYFYLSAYEPEEWLETNAQFVRAASSISGEVPLFAELLIARDAFIDSEIRRKVLEIYSKMNASGVVLWVESLSEHSAPSWVLDAYRRFIDGLVQGNKHVLILHGGYFSTVLTTNGATSVCHGPGYGESREVTPVGGGIPSPTFYHPSLHKRVPYREVAFALERAGINDVDTYLQRVCDCGVCQRLLQQGFEGLSRYGEFESGFRSDGVAFEYATTASKRLSTGHYLYRKKKEFDFVRRNDISTTVQQLRQHQSECFDLFGAEESAHLGEWAKALT
jgi:hypothetical protein